MSLHSSLSAPGCRIHPHIWEEKQLRTNLLRKGHWRGPVSLCGLKGAQQIGSPNEIVGPLLPAELRPPGGPRPEARGSPPCALNLAKLYQTREVGSGLQSLPDAPALTRRGESPARRLPAPRRRWSRRASAGLGSEQEPQPRPGARAERRLLGPDDSLPARSPRVKEPSARPMKYLGSEIKASE